MAILIHNYLIANITIRNQIVDSNGRYILLTCTIFETKITLINLYCPTKDQIKEQEQFYHEIKSILEKQEENNIVMGGDLNTYLNVELDKKGGKLNPSQNFQKILII